MHKLPLTPGQAVVEHGECQEDVINAGQQDEQVVEGVPHRHRGEHKDRERVAQQPDCADHYLDNNILLISCHNMSVDKLWVLFYK